MGTTCTWSTEPCTILSAVGANQSNGLKSPGPSWTQMFFPHSAFGAVWCEGIQRRLQ